MNEDTSLDKCDYDRCHCAVNPDTAVSEGKSVFCSQGCAEEKGCDHPECECREAAPPLA